MAIKHNILTSYPPHHHCQIDIFGCLLVSALYQIFPNITRASTNKNAAIFVIVLWADAVIKALWLEI